MKEETREESIEKMIDLGSQKVSVMRANEDNYLYDDETNFINNQLEGSRPNYQVTNQGLGGKKVGIKIRTRIREMEIGKIEIMTCSV